MRILWQSDYFVATGFATQATEITRRLAKAGHDVSVIGWQYFGQPMENEGVTVFPSSPKPGLMYGEGQFPRKLREINPDLIITLGEAYQLIYMRGVLREQPWLAYIPIDGDVIPRLQHEVLQCADQLIAYSKYGYNILKRHGFDARYIPHAIDLDMFKPITDEQREKWKANIGFAGKRVISCVARANPRKHHMRLLRVFELLRKKYNDIGLYLHTDITDMISRVDLMELCDVLGIGDHVRVGNFDWTEGVPTELMRHIYGSSEFMLLTTAGEGFGLPLLESMACGTPCVATNCTTIPELVQGRGEMIDVSRVMIEDESKVPRSWCDINDAVEKCSRILDDPNLRKFYSNESLKFAEKYSFDKIMPKWEKLIARCELDMEDAVFGTG